MKLSLKVPLLIALLFLTRFAFSQQEKVNVDLVIGGSNPVLYHGGIGILYIPNASFDFDFGSDFNNDDNGRLYALTINHAYYFGHVHSKVHKKLLSINSGFSFLVEQTKHLKSTTGYLNLFFARKFPITKRIFIQPELGAAYFLFEHIVDQDNYVINGYRTRIIPKLGLSLIVRI